VRVWVRVRVLVRVRVRLGLRLRLRVRVRLRVRLRLRVRRLVQAGAAGSMSVDAAGDAGAAGDDSDILLPTDPYHNVSARKVCRGERPTCRGQLGCGVHRLPAARSQLCCSFPSFVPALTAVSPCPLRRLLRPQSTLLPGPLVPRRTLCPSKTLSQ